MQFELLSVVELLEDVDKEVKKGEIGTIVEIFDNPDEAYEVEFVNSHGEQTLITYTLKPEQLRLIKKHAIKSFPFIEVDVAVPS
ncbi:DUF4926 domain-containing protein [Candidatus Poribacteria bacterium]|nr:DUF4926 domain-containing protein [Candidatus Poribacteria bacterium]